MNSIKLSQILRIENLEKYKLHLAASDGDEHPLDVVLRDWNDWIGWNQWKGDKNDFSREYIFSVIKIHEEIDKWLFGGIFKVVERHNDSYKVVLQDECKEFIGRLVIHYHRSQGHRGRAFNLENQFYEFEVSEILRKPYNGLIIK